MILARIDPSNDPFVIEASERLPFIAKPQEVKGISVRFLGQDLQCDDPVFFSGAVHRRERSLM